MLANKSLLSKMIVPAYARSMATATVIRDKFEAAYIARTASLNKVVKKV
jgi:hypothetical protein